MCTQKTMCGTYTHMQAHILHHTTTSYTPHHILTFLFTEPKQQHRSQHDETLLADMRASVKQDRHLILGIHSIEGLAEPSAQSLLSEVAGLPNVQIIATMDHVDTPLLWDKETAARFNWLWHDATTLAPYSEEVKGFQSVLEGRRYLWGGGIVGVVGGCGGGLCICVLQC